MSVLVRLGAIAALGLGLLGPITLRSESIAAATPAGSSPAPLACEDASGTGECCPHAVRDIATHTAPPCENASLCAAKSSRVHLAAGQAGHSGFSQPFRPTIFYSRNDPPTRADQRLQVDRPSLRIVPGIKNGRPKW